MRLKVDHLDVASLSTAALWRLVVCLLVISLISPGFSEQTDSYDQIGYPVSEIFTIDDYQQHDQNWAVMQGNNGLMYVANGFGLMEYDRSSWRLYPTPNRTRIRSMTEWKDGLIYVGTNHDIGRYRSNDQGELTFESLINDWPDEDRRFGEVWSVASSEDWVVFSASEKLMLFDGEQVVVMPDFKPGTRNIFTLDDAFIMHRAQSNELIRIVPGSTPRIESVTTNLPDSAVPRNMRSNPDGSITLITAVNGILRVHGDSVETLVDHSQLNPDAVVYSSYWADDDTLYLGTLKHGLFILDADLNIVRNYRQQHQIGSNTILDINADRQGNIWLSGAPTITRMLPPHQVSAHKTDDQGQSMHLVIDHNGMKIGAGLGLYVLKADENPLFPPLFRSVPSLTNLQFWDAISTRDGLLTARNDGIVLMSFTADDAVSREQILIPSSFAYQIERVPDTDLYYAITQDGLHRLERLEDGSWRSDMIDGVDRTARTLLIEDSHTLWVGSPESKLYRIELDDQGHANVDRFENETVFDPGDTVPFMVMGTIYIGTPGGVFTYEPTQDPPFQPADGLPPALSEPHLKQFRALTDQSGRLWYQTERQIQVAKLVDGQWQTRDRLFTALDDQDLMSIHNISADEVWAVQQEGGVITLNLAIEGTKDKATELKIRQISAINSDQVYYRGSGDPSLPRLDQHSNSLRIEYALPDFLSTKGSQYRVRLLGSDSDQWSDWSSETRKDYTLLRGGDYQFEVQARNRFGRLSETRTITWSVEPHWALSPMAILCYLLVSILALILAGVAGSKWRKRKTLVYEAELTRQVAEQTQELARANERLRTLANSDGLTGLANRRLLDRKLEQAAANQQHVALIMIDVDHFKQFNDNNGHLAGDDLLKSLATILSELDLPAEGIVARFGGEEFAVLLPGSTGSSALIEAQQLHMTINARLPVTVSMGIAHATLNRNEDIPALIERADMALYRAKESGRNTIESLQTVA